MRRALVAATLSASLLAPMAGQSPLLGSLCSFLSSLWSGATADAGCGADPDGRCAPAPRPTTDEGGGWDPNG
ncbi:MAG: hypothetical protein JF614_15785 [Acidobacteria bacterium]|nr:hypothetical protein [Acidobacteriota bacterium]